MNDLYRSILVFLLSTISAGSCCQWTHWAGEGVGNSGNLIKVNETFYLSRDLSGIKKSNDDGASWEALSGWGGSTKSLFDYDGVLLIGTTTGIFRSEDLGDTWVNVKPYGTARHIHRFKAFGSDIFALFQGIQMGADGGILRSSDQGLTWTPVFYQSQYPVEDIIEHGGALYHIYIGGMVKSTNGGSTWTMVAPLLAGETLGSNGATMFLGGDIDIGNVYYSLDSAGTWLPGTGIPSTWNATRSSSIVQFNGYMYGVFGHHVVRSLDGISWSQYEDGIDGLGTSIRRLHILSGNLYAVGTSNIYKLQSTVNIAEYDKEQDYYFDMNASVIRSYSGEDHLLDVMAVDNMGRVVLHVQKVRLSQLNLPGSLAAGVYTFHIREEQGVSIVRGVVSGQH